MKIFIDKFFVPAVAINEFISRMNDNRSFLKNLQGFEKDEAYFHTDNDGNMTVVTLAFWENDLAIQNAKEAVQAEYQRIGFNMADFITQLNIKIDRGIYDAMNEF